MPVWPSFTEGTVSKQREEIAQRHGEMKQDSMESQVVWSDMSPKGEAECCGRDRQGQVIKGRCEDVCICGMKWGLSIDSDFGWNQQCNWAVGNISEVLV